MPVAHACWSDHAHTLALWFCFFSADLLALFMPAVRMTRKPQTHLKCNKGKKQEVNCAKCVNFYSFQFHFELVRRALSHTFTRTGAAVQQPCWGHAPHRFCFCTLASFSTSLRPHEMADDFFSFRFVRAECHLTCTQSKITFLCSVRSSLALWYFSISHKFSSHR